MDDIYGLVGYPLGHSFSRKFFNEKFAAEHIDAQYLNFEINNIDILPDVIAGHPNLRGFNVTIPYKQQVMAYLDGLDDTAKEIGAVNVVKVSTDRGGVHLKGYNSDCIGFVRSIQPLLKPSHTKALVLGTGGASKAVAWGLKHLGVEPTFVSRTKHEGQYTYDDLKEHTSIMAEHTVIVNTTPLGTFPNTDTCPDIPYELITPEHLCYDLVYNPEVTQFMERSARGGAITKNGAEMLLLQALAAWDIWNQ